MHNFNSKSIGTIFYFLIFWGQFRVAGNSVPGPSKAEKLTALGKKKKIVITSRGTAFRVDTKKMLFQYIVGQAMFLKDYVYRRLRRTCIYGNQGLINNLRAESS